MPFVWLLDGYTRCVLACLDCSGACCGPSRATSSDAADDATRPEPPPPASAPEGDGRDAPDAPDADEPGRAGDAAVPPVRY